jgi:transposase
MAITDSHGLPIAIHIESASPHESKLVEETLDHRFLREKPHRIIGDKAYDSDALDEKLRKQKIRLIAPHRRGRKAPETQDGRELRRYKRRWKVERLFAWLHNFRRVATRWDTKVKLYEGFVKLACIIILARNLF